MLSTSSLSDTYFLSSRAKSKLTREASRHDHDLRVLVSHANLLDSLMDSIHEKKKERYKQRQLQLQQQRVMNYNNHSGSISDLANTKRTTYNSPILEQNDDDDYMDSDSDSDVILTMKQMTNLYILIITTINPIEQCQLSTKKMMKKKNRNQLFK